MIPELAQTPTPLREAVRAAEHALDKGNRGTDTPLACLPLAGNAIRAHQELTARCLDLLDAIGAPTSEGTTLQIQGRIRALHEQENT